MFVAIGCASLQKPVDDVYLSEADQQEKTMLSDIGKSIVEKKAEKDHAETAVSISRQVAEISNAEVAVLDAQKTVLLIKDKLADFTNDSVQKAAVKQQLSSNDIIRKKNDAHIAYCLAKIDADEALFKVRESELGVLVARLDFEKSKIALKYQIKRQGEKSKDLIEPAKFEEYLKKQDEDLAKKKQDLIKKNELLTKAEENEKKVQGAVK